MAGERPKADFGDFVESANAVDVPADETLDGDFLAAALTLVAALAATVVGMAVVSVTAACAPDLATAATGPDFAVTGTAPDCPTAFCPAAGRTTLELPDPAGGSSDFATGNGLTRLLSSVVLPPGDESIPFFVSTRALS